VHLIPRIGAHKISEIDAVTATRDMTRGRRVFRPDLCSLGGSTTRPFSRSTCRQRRARISFRRAPVNAMSTTMSRTCARSWPSATISSIVANRRSYSFWSSRIVSRSLSPSSRILPLKGWLLRCPSSTAQERAEDSRRIALRAEAAPPIRRTPRAVKTVRSVWATCL
jgi:hypothetical protein